MATHTVIGTAAPAVAPTELAQHFVDTAEPAVYISTGTATSADYQKLALVSDVPTDASGIGYTPAVPADWDGGTDPGEANDALDQLAERVTDLEAGAGTGDVVGPASSTDNAIALFDGLTGKLLKDGPLPTSVGLDLIEAANAGAGRSAISAAALAQTSEMMAGYIGAPSAKDYRIVVKASHGGTITETTTRSESGTGTITFKINTTALGGTANSASSSEESQAHASNNVFSAGDDIVLTPSSLSSLIGLSFTIKYTRTLE